MCGGTPIRKSKRECTTLQMKKGDAILLVLTESKLVLKETKVALGQVEKGWKYPSKMK